MRGSAVHCQRPLRPGEMRRKMTTTDHPKVRFHFTPTYSSWLNQIELWFATIQRDLLARGVFTSLADLSRKIRKYIRAYAKVARPFRWSHSDPSRRIVANPMSGTAYQSPIYWTRITRRPIVLSRGDLLP